jgi:hypothetical protein
VGFAAVWPCGWCARRCGGTRFNGRWTASSRRSRLDRPWFVEARLTGSPPVLSLFLGWRWSQRYDGTTARYVTRRAPTSQSGAVSRRTGEGQTTGGGRGHRDHPIRATTRPARTEPQRDNERAASSDQSRRPAPRLPGRHRGRRPGDIQALLRHVPAATGSHRVPWWLAAKVPSRICLDLLGSARARREGHVGEWIPEPLPDRTEWINGPSAGTTVDPADRVTLTSRTTWPSSSCSNR